MNFTKHLIVTAFSLSLAACGSEPEEAKKAEVKTESSDKQKEQAAILAPHMKTLNNAKNMEQKLKDAEAERKKKMDEQEGVNNDKEEDDTDS